MKNKVAWKNGLFIKQQHFQQNDRAIANEFMLRSLNQRANNWGLFDLKINNELLKIGKIVIEYISGIMPDGTIFDMNAQEQTLILDVATINNGSLVYLALPITTNNSDNVYFEDQQQKMSTRYVAKMVKNIPDINAGENDNTDILMAEYNFYLLLENQINDKFVKIPIAKIANVSIDREILFDEDFVPVSLNFNNSFKLVSATKGLLNMISHRANAIANNLNDIRLQSTELGNYLMLQLLNRVESRIEYFLSQNKVHPDEVYLELLTLLSELAVFMTKQRRVVKKPIYIHEEQANSFNIIFDKLKFILANVLEQNSIALNIEKKNNGIYIATIKDKSIIKDSTFIFSISSETSKEKVKELLQEGLKFGTVENIRKLVNYHLVGYKIKSLSTPPKEIPFKVNHLYFSIELSQKEKEDLEKSAGFAFYLANSIENISYSIWAIKG